MYSTLIAPEEEKQEFDEAIDRHANPQIHECSKVRAVCPMLSRWWEAGLNTEIDSIANNDGDQVFDPAF